MRAGPGSPRAFRPRGQQRAQAGLGSLSNGGLLDAAEAAGFEAFIIADKNLRYQQNLSRRRIAILELWTNHRPTLEKHFDRIRAAVGKLSPGDYSVLEP